MNPAVWPLEETRRHFRVLKRLDKMTTAPQPLHSLFPLTTFLTQLYQTCQISLRNMPSGQIIILAIVSLSPASTLQVLTSLSSRRRSSSRPSLPASYQDVAQTSSLALRSPSWASCLVSCMRSGLSIGACRPRRSGDREGTAVSSVTSRLGERGEC